jgi:hypothetical protein
VVSREVASGSDRERRQEQNEGALLSATQAQQNRNEEGPKRIVNYEKKSIDNSIT